MGQWWGGYTLGSVYVVVGLCCMPILASAFAVGKPTMVVVAVQGAPSAVCRCMRMLADAPCAVSRAGTSPEDRSTGPICCGCGGTSVRRRRFTAFRP